MRLELFATEDDGISRYAEPDAEGIMDVWRTILEY